MPKVDASNCRHRNPLGGASNCRFYAFPNAGSLGGSDSYYNATPLNEPVRLGRRNRPHGQIVISHLADWSDLVGR